MVGEIKGTITSKQSLNGELTAPKSVGISDYEDLTNKPSIENVTLVGDKSFEDLGFYEASNQDILNLFK